ncbi:MAG: cytochrome c [Bacteroidetes bacterium]|nr:cytochrome c [Bacteroidota bacterium]
MKLHHPSLRSILCFMGGTLYLVLSSCGGGKGTDESLPAGEPPTPKSDTAQVWVAPESTHGVMNPQPASAASIEKGKSIYLQYCVTCHGADGKAEVPAGIAVKASNLLERTPAQSDGALHWKLITGRNAMLKISAYGISDEDGWHIINYVRTLTKI